jgi:hypothetical protein
MNEYREARFRSGGRIRGDAPGRTAGHALEIFRARGVRSVLVPGAGCGRNTRLFAAAGLAVLETGLAEDEEDHGEEGPHTHVLRYICVQR